METREDRLARLTAEGRVIVPQVSVFVFGSNEGGHHGAGAARYAYEKRGAKMGMSFGPMGSSFAIPTKDPSIRHTLPLSTIKQYVDAFIAFTKVEKEIWFQVTKIGCGLAGLKNEQVAPLFNMAPHNCLFDTDWEPFMLNRVRFWGTG